MKTTELTSQNNDYIRELEKRLKLKRQAKEAELEKVQAAYDKNIENVKNLGEEQYAQHVKLNEDRYANTTKVFENRLNEYKENYEKTKNNLEKETENINEDHQNKIANIRQRNLDTLQLKNLQGKEEQEKLQNNFKISTEEIAKNYNIDRNKIESTAREKLLEMAAGLEQKELNDEKTFRSELDQNSREHIELVADQRQHFKNSIDKKENDFKRMENEKKIAQNNEIEFLDNHFKNTISQKNSDFKIRYQAMAQEHDAILNELKTHFELDVKKMVEQNAAQKRILASREDDKFYKIETLNPKLSETDKEILITLPVAEHEKENIIISASDRNIRISLTRKYNDKFEEENGSVNKANRSEVITKELNSKDLLNSKAVTQKYENGVMSFRIQKR